MEGFLTVPVAPRTCAWGRAFEPLVVCECVRLSGYWRADYRLHFLKTKSGREIDLIIDRPGKPSIVIEIKSTDKITDDHGTNLRHFASDFPDAELRLW